MKLAEALLHRAELQKTLASLKARLASNVRIQEGDVPSENPSDLLVAAQQVIGHLAKLINQIHQTNAQARLADGRRLLDLLTQRDELLDRHKLLQVAIDHTKATEERYSYREIKWSIVIPVASLQQQADDLSVKIRDLNILIQATNWQIDLVA